MNGNELVLDADGDTSITANTDDVIDLRARAKDQWQWDGTANNEGNFVAIDTDTGAAAGPIWAMYRNATGATNDVLGRLLWQGKDDGGTKTDFSQIEVELTDASAGTEDSTYNLWNTVGGTLTEQWHIGAGIYAEGNTDPGAGKIDADDLLISGNTVQPMTTQGDVITGASSGVPQRLALGTSTYALKSDGTDAVWAPSAAGKNLLINGEFNIWQRATTITAATTHTNGDDKYIADRWILLSDGNDIVDVSRDTDAPIGSINSFKADVQTINKKFGIVQFIEGFNCQHVVESGSQQVTLSFYAKTTAATIENIRAGIISWSSTQDSVTSDVVSTWEAEGTNPVLASNLTYENTPANILLTTSWAQQKITATIDTASTTNLH